MFISDNVLCGVLLFAAVTAFALGYMCETTVKMKDVAEEKAETKDEISDTDVRGIETAAGEEDDASEWQYTKEKGFPSKPGNYLVWRDYYGKQYPQVLSFEGRFWIAGSDYPDNKIIAWKEIKPPEEE